MLPAPARTASGRRLYGPAERRTLAFIRRSRDLGFTLEEIRALLALGGPERASCADVHKIASTHLANVRNKLSDLVKLETILAETVAQCSDGATPDCPVLDILDAGRQRTQIISDARRSDRQTWSIATPRGQIVPDCERKEIDDLSA